jgi:hypothetical protein
MVDRHPGGGKIPGRRFTPPGMPTPACHHRYHRLGLAHVAREGGMPHV